MEFFPDGMHLRLRNRKHGSYLHADEDGVYVSLTLHRASLNTAWQVHRVLRDGGDYVLLHSAAYGRYLALSPDQVSLVYVGHHAVQGVYESPEQDDVLCEAVWVDDDEGGGVLMLHVSNRLLRAAPWNPLLNSRVFVDIDNARHDDALGGRDHPPETGAAASPPLPAVTPLPRGVVLWRTIVYMRADDHGNFNPVDRRMYGFSGRSLYQLTGDLANQLREQFHRITLCVRAGSHGRPTPLVIDLPSNQQAMEIIVLTAMSPEFRLEEQGNATPQDQWFASKLDGAMPARKERSIARSHKQDQVGSGKGVLVALSDAIVKLSSQEDGKEKQLEALRINERCMLGPWWYSFNKEMEMA